MGRKELMLIGEIAEALINPEVDLEENLKRISVLLHFYVASILTRKAKAKNTVKLKLSIKEALSLISATLHIPKTPFRAKKRGLDFSAYDVLKNLEAMELVKVRPFNYVEILKEVEFEGDEK